MASFVNLIDQRRLIGPGGSTVGGEIFFYYTNTSVLAPIFYDVGMTVPAPNPIAVGAGDIVPVLFLDETVTYRRVIVYSDGTRDEVDPLNPLGGESGEDVGVPIGGVIDFAGTVAPVGFLLCDGSNVSRTDYSALFAAIGVTYGAGDGSSTFTLPDYRGRVSAGKDNMGGIDAGRLSLFSGTILGSGSGNQSHTLVLAEIPSHNHTGTASTDGDHYHTTSGTSAASNGTAEVLSGAFGGGNNQQTPSNFRVTAYAGEHTHSITIDNAGSGDSHDNVQPTLIVNKIIKYSNTGTISLEAITAIAASAWEAAGQSQLSALASEASALKSEGFADASALAGVAVGVYRTTIEGIEATTNGQSFYVTDGTDFALYENNAGVADLVITLPTASDVNARVPYTELASTDPSEGASLVGVDDGGTVQEAVGITLAQLSAIVGAVDGRAAFITDTGKEGRFVFSASDHSADVTIDTLGGMFIPPASDLTGASGAWVRDTSAGLPITATGAIPGDMGVGYHNELSAVFLLSATYGIPVTGVGHFRTDETIVLSSSFSGLTVSGPIQLDLYGSFTSNTAALLIPQTTDNYGGNVAPANNVYIERIECDGSNATSTGFTTGIAVFGGIRNRFGSVVTHDFIKSGMLVASTIGAPIDVHIDDLVTYHNTNGINGQGVATSAKNTYDSVTFGRIVAFENGSFGFDWSEGSVTINYLESYGNNTGGATGGGGKWAGGNDQKIRIGQCYLHDNLGTGAFSNTEAFTLLEIDHLECVDNNGEGLALNFDGVTNIGSAFLRGNGVRGIFQSTGSLNIGTAIADGNGGNAGVASGGDGDVSIGRLVSKNHASGCGFLASTSGQVTLGSGTSTNDNNGCVRLVPSSPNNKHTIGPIAVHYDGSPSSGYGVFMNGNSEFARLGRIIATGGASRIGGTGSNPQPETVLIRATGSSNPGTIAAGGTYTTTLAAVGAELGDSVDDISFDQDLGAVTLSGSVVADQIKVTFFNPSGSGVTLSSGSLRARVKKWSY